MLCYAFSNCHSIIIILVHSCGTNSLHLPIPDNSKQFQTIATILSLPRSCRLWCLFDMYSGREGWRRVYISAALQLDQQGVLVLPGDSELTVDTVSILIRLKP